MRKHLITIITISVMCAMSTIGMATGVDTTSPDLPPPGVYVSPQQYHEYAAAGILLDDPSHYPFTENVQREAVGNDEIETFDSLFTATEIGLGLGPVSLTGPVQVRTINRALSTTGTFATEIISMSLMGNTPLGIILIRQDPSRPSTGQTDITDLGGGLYHIDSFFDVFTEMSPDGGGTWIPSDYATHMVLVPIPEPSSLALIGIGLLALMRRK